MDIAYLEDLVYYGKYDVALPLILRQEKVEKSAELEFLKGICLRETGDTLGAISCFKEAESMGMENKKRLYHEIAWTYLKMGKKDEAIDALRRIEDPEVMVEEAEILEESGDLSRAEELVDSVIRNTPSLGAYLKKAEIMVRKGDLKGAIGLLRSIKDERADVIANFLEIVSGKANLMKGNENFLPYVVGLSISYALNGNLDKAEEEARRAVSLDPYSPLLHTVLGAILLIEGKDGDEELKKGKEWRELSYMKEGIIKEGVKFLVSEMIRDLVG